MNEAIAVVSSLSLLTSIGTIIGLVMKFSTKEDAKDLKDAIAASEARSDKKIDMLQVSIAEQGRRYDDLVCRINSVSTEMKEALGLLKVQNNQFDTLNNQLKESQKFLYKTDDLLTELQIKVGKIEQN